MMWMYAIIVIVILGLYSASITYRYLDIHAKYHKQKIHMSLHDVLNEIMSMIHKEDNMDKGYYKSSKSSEYIDGQHIEPIYFDGVPNPTLHMDNSPDSIGKGYVINSTGSLAVMPKAPSLTSLLEAKPTDEDYETILGMLIELFRLTYNEYKFYLAKSSDETKMPNFLQVTSPSTEHPDLHKAIFKLAVDTNMDMLTLQKKFAQKVAEGKVADLGENVTIILDDNTPQLPTAVSPVQSGLEGSEISFIISFLKTENFNAWHKFTFPEDAKDGE